MIEQIQAATSAGSRRTSTGGRRRRLADWMIRSGLILQIVFLLFVDWGTIVGFAKSAQTPWIHIGGLFLLNVVLLACSYFAWTWMRRAEDSNAIHR